MDKRQKEYIDRVRKSIDPPLLRNVVSYGLSQIEINYLFTIMFGQPIEVDWGVEMIVDVRNNELYSECETGWCVTHKDLALLWKRKYKDEVIYLDSDGYYSNIAT